MKNRFNRLTSKEWLPFQKSWFKYSNDETLYRRDADKNEINSMMSDPDKYCKIWRDFPTTKQPKYWVVWPYSTSKGWCDRLTGQLNIG